MIPLGNKKERASLMAGAPSFTRYRSFLLAVGLFLFVLRRLLFLGRFCFLFLLLLLLLQLGFFRVVLLFELLKLLIVLLIELFLLLLLLLFIGGLLRRLAFQLLLLLDFLALQVLLLAQLFDLLLMLLLELRINRRCRRPRSGWPVVVGFLIGVCRRVSLWSARPVAIVGRRRDIVRRTGSVAVVNGLARIVGPHILRRGQLCWRRDFDIGPCRLRGLRLDLSCLRDRQRPSAIRLNSLLLFGERNRGRRRGGLGNHGAGLQHCGRPHLRDRARTKHSFP